MTLEEEIAHDQKVLESLSAAQREELERIMRGEFVGGIEIVLDQLIEELPAEVREVVLRHARKKR